MAQQESLLKQLKDKGRNDGTENSMVSKENTQKYLNPLPAILAAIFTGGLGFGIVLEDGYTLRGYFRMVERYTPLTKLNAFFPLSGGGIRIPAGSFRPPKLDIPALRVTSGQ